MDGGTNDLDSASYDFDVVSFFGPYVKEWLNSTDSRTGQWVQTAIVVDKVRTLFQCIPMLCCLIPALV